MDTPITLPRVFFDSSAKDGLAGIGIVAPVGDHLLEWQIKGRFANRSAETEANGYCDGLDKLLRGHRLRYAYGDNPEAVRKAKKYFGARGVKLLLVPGNPAFRSCMKREDKLSKKARVMSAPRLHRTRYFENQPELRRKYHIAEQVWDKKECSSLRFCDEQGRYVKRLKERPSTPVQQYVPLDIDVDRARRELPDWSACELLSDNTNQNLNFGLGVSLVHKFGSKKAFHALYIYWHLQSIDPYRKACLNLKYDHSKNQNFVGPNATAAVLREHAGLSNKKMKIYLNEAVECGLLIRQENGWIEPQNSHAVTTKLLKRLPDELQRTLYGCDSKVSINWFRDRKTKTVRTYPTCPTDLQLLWSFMSTQVFSNVNQREGAPKIQASVRYHCSLLGISKKKFYEAVRLYGKIENDPEWKSSVHRMLKAKRNGVSYNIEGLCNTYGPQLEMTPGESNLVPAISITKRQIHRYSHRYLKHAHSLGFSDETGVKWLDSAPKNLRIETTFGKQLRNSRLNSSNSVNVPMTSASDRTSKESGTQGSLDRPTPDYDHVQKSAVIEPELDSSFDFEENSRILYQHLAINDENYRSLVEKYGDFESRCKNWQRPTTVSVKVISPSSR